MKKVIKTSLAAAIQDLQKDSVLAQFSIPDFDVSYPPDPSFGDYTTNIALILAKHAKMNPMEIARHIQGAVKQDHFSKIEAVQPGYLNFFLSDEYLRSTIEHIREEGEQYGYSDEGSGKRVLIEFISSNPTGPIHLGNARGGPVGDTLANVMEKLGYDVEREFLMNDYGNQVEILGHSVLGTDEAQYGGSYIESLSSQKPEELTQPREVGFWAAQKIVDEMIRPTCDKLGIVYDRWFSEKSLHDRGEINAMLDFLKERELVYEKDGAKWYASSQFGDDKDRVLVKSNGRNTYLLADFAYHKNKIDRNYDKLINILGADHHAEAIVVKAFVEKVLEKPDLLHIILTQFVRIMKDGEEVKMSKRRGTFYAMDDLVDEVGKDAVRFLSALYAANSHINFDINLATEQSEKNPVYYVQYAHARICSILEKATTENFTSHGADLSLLANDRERLLIIDLVRFQDILGEVATSYEIHNLPRYAMGIADKLHSFYAACRVIDEGSQELSAARLALVDSVRIVLAETLRILGVSAPRRMTRE